VSQPGDPEIDWQPRRTGSGLKSPVEDCQRLVANPLLTLLLVIGAVASIHQSLRRRDLPLFLSSAGLLCVAFLVVQYHCLDCGHTGWLVRARAHACPAVVARQENRASRQFRTPGMKVQIAVWFIVLAAAFVLGLVALAAWR
jgi:hypothetical protein